MSEPKTQSGKIKEAARYLDFDTEEKRWNAEPKAVLEKPE
jgi:hypothetical protein